MLTRRVIAELLLLLSQCVHPLLQLAPSPLVFVERDHRPEIGIRKPLDVLLQVRPAAAQGFASGQQLLWQPRSAVRPRDGHGERFRLAQQPAEVLPDQLVELTHRCSARGAAGHMTR